MKINEKIDNNYDFFEKISKKTVVVSGATGLIGSTIIDYLVHTGANVVALARNENKAKSFSFFDKVTWIFQDMGEEIIYDGHVDYVIHTASPTDSNFFITHPVETINSTLSGLNNIMDFSKKKSVRSIVFTSSMESYGLCLEDRFLSENEYYPIDSSSIRNSYAEGKKLLECLCVSYANEYNIPVKIIRLCQTFGPGVTIEDNRVFAQFAKKVIRNEDIVLSTKGETKRSYCSLADCVSGILIALLFGENGQIYNVASDDTYYSILEMASKFVKKTNLKVIIREQQESKYLPTIKFGLCTQKIKALGFKSLDNLDSMIDEFLDYYRFLL